MLVKFTDTNCKPFWLSSELKPSCIRQEGGPQKYLPEKYHSPVTTHIFFNGQNPDNVYVMEDITLVKAVFEKK